LFFLSFFSFFLDLLSSLLRELFSFEFVDSLDFFRDSFFSLLFFFLLVSKDDTLLLDFLDLDFFFFSFTT